MDKTDNETNGAKTYQKPDRKQVIKFVLFVNLGILDHKSSRLSDVKYKIYQNYTNILTYTHNLACIPHIDLTCQLLIT